MDRCVLHIFCFSPGRRVLLIIAQEDIRLGTLQVEFPDRGIPDATMSREKIKEWCLVRYMLISVEEDLRPLDYMFRISYSS
jgi:hypothetical protein